MLDDELPRADTCGKTALTEQRIDLLRIYGDEARLSELHRWLTIGGSSWAVGGSAMLVPPGITSWR